MYSHGSNIFTLFHVRFSHSFQACVRFTLNNWNEIIQPTPNVHNMFPDIKYHPAKKLRNRG